MCVAQVAQPQVNSDSTIAQKPNLQGVWHLHTPLYRHLYEEPLSDAVIKACSSRDKEVNMAAGDSDDALTLKDVRYTLGLERRLISVGHLDEEGYHVGFRDQKWKVTKGILVVACGNKHGSLYMVERLGDMSRIGMSMLAFEGNVLDVQKVDIYLCNLGGLGKQKNLSFIVSMKTRKLQRSCGRYNVNLQVKCLKFDNGGEY
nr:hypothetical protein [Tanacetum cinerariifolium]